MAKSVGLKMKPIQARRAGEQVAELLKKDKAKLESRLPAGLLEGVKEDVRLLSNTMSNAIVARVCQVTPLLTAFATAKVILDPRAKALRQKHPSRPWQIRLEPSGKTVPG